MYRDWLRDFLASGQGITAFDGEGDNGDAGDGGGGTPPNPPGDGGKPANNANAPYATFSTQAQLTDRLNQAKRSAIRDLAKEAGFGDDIEGFQAYAKEIKERREREQGELTTLKQREQSLASENATLKSSLRNVALRSAVESVASSLGFHDPGDAFGLANWGDIELGDDGNVDRDKIKARLTELAKAKTYLVKADAANSANNQGDNANNQNGRQGGGSQTRTSAANPNRPPQGKQVVIPAEKEAEYKRRFPILNR